jgi:hypothetical protein
LSGPSGAAATLAADFLAPFDTLRSNDGGARVTPQIDRRLIFFQRPPITRNAADSQSDKRGDAIAAGIAADFFITLPIELRRTKSAARSS